jgi:hypothetical protein
VETRDVGRQAAREDGRSRIDALEGVSFRYAPLRPLTQVP